MPAVNIPDPGIYFGMPEAEYHKTGSLGSSSMKQLAYSPADYWYHSPYNPLDIEKEESEAQLIGTAYHKIVLEGREAFEARYGVAYENGATKAGKEESAVLAAAGKIRIKFDTWQRILLAGAAVRANEVLANAFDGGPTEVSIFWIDEQGIPKKARIDCLKLRSSTDLKTISPQDGMEFPSACIRQMANYRYDVQCAHYNDARAQIPRLLADGCVHGDHDADHLRRVAEQSQWATVFIFLKKKGAPLTYGTMISPGNNVLDLARATIAKADAAYLDCVARYGYETPWLVPHPLEELSVEEMPPWAFKY